jgi:hypothetical protein
MYIKRANILKEAFSDDYDDQDSFSATPLGRFNDPKVSVRPFQEES